MDMPEHKWFYFKHGKRASNIEELKTILEGISDAEFKHHVNNDKNDFANWVEGVFGEQKLANSMREVSDKEGIIILLDDFLSHKDEPPTPEPVLPKEHPKPRQKKVIIPEDKQLSLEPEKELSAKEIKELVDEAMLVFDKAEAGKTEKAKAEKYEEIKVKQEDESEKEADKAEKIIEDETGEEWEPEHKPRLEIRQPSLEKESLQKEHHRFMVEEFLYGFILGLIFGLIMLGVILRLNIS